MSELPTKHEQRIFITHEEAMDAHVDDLLKRHASLRGEGGITRTTRCWYLQSWFIFMVAGMLAALAAWATIEPFFADMIYFQGPIASIQPVDASTLPLNDEAKQLIQGSITMNGEKILILSSSKVLETKKPLDLSKLTTGEPVGVYLEDVKAPDQTIWLAHFVTYKLKTLSAGHAKLTLDQLKARSTAAGLLLFPLVAGLIGLAIGTIDGLICRLARRALLGGLVGLLVGFIGGFVMAMVAGLVYSPLNELALRMGSPMTSGLTPFGMFIQITGRGLAWALAGTAMGLGQGIVLRSGRLLLYGLLGGLIGGLLGGLLFDPIDLLILGPDKPSAAISRVVGLLVIGGCVGAGIGIVELLARDAWLRMVKGPLAGKEFLLFKDMMRIGSSPRADIYLFNDAQVADFHAAIRSAGNECELESLDAGNPAYVNNQSVRSVRLRHGDQVSIGQTHFVFERRRG